MSAIRRMLCFLSCCWVGGTIHAQVSVTTYHNDNARSGANTAETILSPANVNSTQFGKLFSVAVDGAVYSQPLYLANAAIAGGVHNVLLVATEHDSVYAIDADLGTVYQHASLIPAGGTTVNSLADLDCGDLVPEVGITGTPVIDAAGGTLYVVAKSKLNGTIVQHLHALDVGTLQEKFGGPVRIAAAVAGSGYDSVGGTVTFSAKQQHQRAALLLENGHVIIGWSSHCDHDTYHGWVMSYAAGTLAQEAVFNDSPNGSRGGIWMSGGGLAADASGSIYVPTGNGTFNGTSDFGDSVVKLGPPTNGSFAVLDYFTPYDQSTLAKEDEDLGSGGLVLLPALPSGGSFLALQGKQGTIYLLNDDDLGKYCVNLTPACTDSDPQVVQEIGYASGGIWGSPAFWNNTLYWTGSNDRISAYSFNANGSGLISHYPTSVSGQVFAFSAPTPSISANGNTNAILWALDGSADDSTCDGGGGNCLGLYAYDATNLARMLYRSSEAANNRDSPGTAVKFETPVIANGKVYVGTQGSVSAYGLLATQQAATPTFSPASGSYTTAQSVTLADATPGAVIFYTTNGTTPSASSAEYSPGKLIAVDSTTTIEAIATASGFSTSAVGAAAYTITSGPSGTPVSVPLTGVDDVYGIAAGGSAVTDGGLDGRSNAYAAALLGSSISWAGSSFSFGAPGAADAARAVTIALPAGSYAALTVLGTAVNGNQPAQTFIVTYTDGTTSSFTQSLSDWYDPQNYPGESVVLTMPYRIASSGATDDRPFNLYGYSFALNGAKSVKSLTLPKNNDVVVLAIDLSPSAAAAKQTATPTFSPAPGTYSGTQSVTLADATAGAAVYYTTNGTIPSTGSTRYLPGTPIQVSSTTTIEAIAVASGDSTSTAISGLYTITASPTAATPTFSPTPGRYTGTQSVTLVDATAGAAIYYTTNGSAPTTGSERYSPGTPISLASTSTIEAIAVANGYVTSPIAQGTYTIAQAGAPVSVALGNLANVDAIASTGILVRNGGLDGKGNAYAAALLGASIDWNGASFTLGAANTTDAMSATVLPLPAGTYASLTLLATAVNGNQLDQTFRVTYTDGTTTLITQSVSDWSSFQGYSGETVALPMAYRITSSGAADDRTFNLYGYSFAINAAKTLKSLTLPANRDVVVLAVDVTP